jgi:pimeloyl-ACP methyl ester carboxylesterase
MISVGSHRLQVRMRGTGTPAVVIDTGLGETLDSMQQLQDRLAEVTLVISFNRAGYGRSEPGPLPRHGEQAAGELQALLEAAAVPGPYVLVGHSLGGLNMQVFASKHPEDVAAMVLLDPPPLSFIVGQEHRELRSMADQMTAEWQAMADAGSDSPDPEERRKAVFFRTIASEQRQMFGEAGRKVDSISAFGDTPLVVMAAGRPNPMLGPGAEEFQRYWIDQSRFLIEKSTSGVFILVSSSSHFLHRDAPELVAQTIVAVVLEARQRSSE